MEKALLKKISDQLGLSISLMQVQNPFNVSEKDLISFNAFLNEIPSFSFFKNTLSGLSISLTLDQNEYHLFINGKIDLENLPPSLWDQLKQTTQTMSARCKLHLNLDFDTHETPNFSLSLVYQGIIQ